MAVNGINQSHPAQTEKVHTVSPPKAQNGTPKATTANSTAKLSEANQAHGTTAAAVAENNAGREQGNRQNTENTETKGTRINVRA